MVTVYVLLSLKDNATYVGMALNTDNRLKEHNTGKNRYTKGHLPWKITYTEIHPDWAAARVREKYLKSTTGKAGISVRGTKKSFRYEKLLYFTLQPAKFYTYCFCLVCGGFYYCFEKDS